MSPWVIVGAWTVNAVAGLVVAVYALVLGLSNLRDALETRSFLLGRGDFLTLVMVAQTHVDRARSLLSLVCIHIGKQSINLLLGAVSLASIEFDGLAREFLAWFAPLGLLLLSIGTTVSSVILVRQMRADRRIRNETMPTKGENHADR